MLLPFLQCFVAFIVTMDLTDALKPSRTGALLSRQEFVLTGLSFPILLNSPTIAATSNSLDDIIEIPLTFLKNGGCLAVKISLNDRSYSQQIFGYYAIVDTGSPFLTAPQEITHYSKDASSRYPVTDEQYGEAVGTMNWRSVSNVEILTKNYEVPLALSKLIAGLPESNVVDDTGGIFLGLIWKDDNRPSFSQQSGYASFVLDYQQRMLTLSRRLTIEEADPDALKLFDLTPYGKDLYHYGVMCTSFTLLDNKKKQVTVKSLARPIIAVIDSGLTGCVFSDSLQNELLGTDYMNNLEQLKGLQLSIPTIGGTTLALTSNPDYWLLSSFKLPWFDDDATHPHVIVMGATFLSKLRISVDPLGGRAKLEI